MELALAHPELRLLHEPRSVRRDGRFHHRAGNLADVRRADRPVGGRSLDVDGLAQPGAADRARPGPRHADERRAARRAHRPGLSRRARRLRWSRRARRSPQSSTSTLLDRGAPIAWAQSFAEASRGSGDRHRQRVPRRAAGPAIRAGGGQWRERVVRLDERRRTRLRRRRRRRSRSSRRRGRGRRDARSQSGRPSLHVRTRRAAREAGRRGAVHRLRPRGRPASATRCRRCAPIASSIRWPSPASATSPRMSISPRWRAAPRAAGAAVYGPIDQGDFLRAIGIDARTQRARRARRPERARGDRSGARRAWSARANGEMGALFKVMAIANRALPAPPGFQPDRGEAGVSAAEFLTARDARAAGRRARLLHPPRRRLRGRLRLAQRRRRLARRAGGGRREPRAHGGGARRRAGAARRSPIRSIRPTRSRSPRRGRRDARPRCDGLVTATPGLGARRHRRRLRHDPVRRRRGARDRRRARRLERRADRRRRGDGRGDGAARRAGRARSRAALGPCIAQASYEVGPEFVAAFAGRARRSAVSSSPSRQRTAARCSTCTAISPSGRAGRRRPVRGPGLDTYADEARFFSYRRTTHRDEPDYGRLVSAIALA